MAVGSTSITDPSPAPGPGRVAYPAGIDWAAPLPVHPLDRLLDEAVERFDQRPCLDFLDRKYSFREIGDLVARAAKGLRALGVVKGTRVGLFLPNTPYYIICYYAVLKAGGTVVNFNPLYAEPEVRHLLADSGAEIMVTLDLALLYPSVARLIGSAQLRRIVVCPMAGILPFAKSWLFRLFKRRDVARWHEDEVHVAFARLIDNDGIVPDAAIEPRRDVAVLQYTGGTTGTPKGAMLTHANLLANTMQCRLWFQGTKESGERVLAVLPFFHVFAMTSAMNFAISVGAEIIMLPRFELKMLLRTIARKKPTIFPGVPTIYTAINNSKETVKYDLTSVKACISGGAPLPVEVKASFERLTGCVLVEGYGLSEASPVVACNPFNGANKPGSVGLPLPGTLVEIVALDEPPRVLPKGERGEICVSGPQIMAGYWGKPEETARVLAGGRLHTGDVGYLDSDGYLFLVDRIKDVIIASGYKIYPRNVEEAIYQHRSVAECIVLGLPDPYRGQTVKAYVVRTTAGQDLTEAALLAFLADKLSPMEMPKQIEFRASLPKTLIGKPSKKDLLAEEAQREAARAAG